jgi:ABC-type Zn2+ transport system substrate-binding protein/surface adhesin
LKFQKHKLPEILEKFNPELSEKENVLANGYKIVKDCGSFVFTYLKSP